MDLEQLTKHQIVLLTLLVSFVTSIATGIVTVSLMAQAPSGVTKVVNQIVEHTVERVVPSTQGASVATTEKTVVVKDDDLAASSIAKVQKSIVRIVGRGEDTVIAKGVITAKNGSGSTDKQALDSSGKALFDILLPSGERLPITISPESKDSPLATFVLGIATTTQFTPVALADISKLALGQSVIRIDGRQADTVATGVVSMLGNGNAVAVEASVAATTPGGLLMTLFGEVIGIATSASIAAGGTSYMPLSGQPPPAS